MLYIALHCHVNCIYALTSCADDESLIALEINTHHGVVPGKIKTRVVSGRYWHAGNLSLYFILYIVDTNGIKIKLVILLF